MKEMYIRNRIEDEICANCGEPFGVHRGAGEPSPVNGNACPSKLGRGFWKRHSVFVSTGCYKQTKDDEEPVYRFKEGTTLRDLLNTNPRWSDIRWLLDEVMPDNIHPVECINSDVWEKAINKARLGWKTRLVSFGLLEKFDRQLSFTVEVDGRIVWKGPGKNLCIKKEYK